METTIFWLEVAILAAVILNILKDLFWSKRQKEYYKAITPTKILGNLKSLKELLDSTAEDRDKLTETVKELKQEIERLEKEDKSRKVALTVPEPVRLDFGFLKEIQGNISTAMEPYRKVAIQMDELSDKIKEKLFLDLDMKLWGDITNQKSQNKD